MTNNIGKILYVTWFFFYAVIIMGEILQLRTQSLGEVKLGMLFGTMLFLLIGLVLFLASVFTVKKTIRLLFALSFLAVVLLSLFFYISLTQNAALTS